MFFKKIILSLNRKPLFFYSLLRRLFHKYSKLGKDESFFEPLYGRNQPKDDHGWDFIENNFAVENEHALFVEGVSLSPLFREPHDSINSIQIEVARSIFRLIGAYYIPKRLHTALCKADAFQAINHFLIYFGFKFENLLKPGQERDQLNNILGILLDVDEMCKKIKITDLPIYQALKERDFSRAEKLVDRLALLYRVQKGIEDSIIIFPGYKATFVTPARKKMKHWENLNQDMLVDLVDILNDWKNLQNEYNELINELTVTIGEIQRYGIGDATLKGIFSVIVNNVNDTKYKIENGSIEAHVGIDNLYVSYSDLKVILEKIQETRDQNKKSSSGKQHSSQQNTGNSDKEYISKKENILNEYLGALNLIEVEQITNNHKEKLKKVYRIFRSKWHTDKIPGEPDRHAYFNEQFRLVTEVYEFILASRKII